jgi:hypothetical protein
MKEDWGRNGKVVEFTPIVWHRTNASNGGGNRFTHSFEMYVLCFVGGRQRAGTWNRDVFSAGSQGRHNVIDLPELALNQKFVVQNDTEPLNTMQKPIAFYWWLLSLLCKETDTILSVCSGSGSMAAACMVFGCSCDSVDIDPLQVQGSIKRVQILKQEEVQGKWAAHIEPAVVQLEALRLSRSWTGAKGIREWVARSNKYRVDLGNRISKNEVVICGREDCKENIVSSSFAFLCGNLSCNKWLHRHCKEFAVNKILACSKACQDAILRPGAEPNTSAAASSSSSNDPNQVVDFSPFVDDQFAEEDPY